MLKCPLGLDSGIGFVCDNLDLAELGLDISLQQGFMAEELSEDLDSKKFFDGSSFDGFDGVHSLPAQVDACVQCPSVDLEPFCLPPVHKRRNKPVRKVEHPLLVVGEDIALNDIVLTNELTLVGRFGGHRVSLDGVKNWVLGTWKNITCPDIFILPRGWLAFKFKFEADVARILVGVWKWKFSGLMLKRWTPLFDPRNERYDSIPIWVKIPN